MHNIWAHCNQLHEHETATTIPSEQQPHAEVVKKPKRVTIKKCSGITEYRSGRLRAMDEWRGLESFAMPCLRVDHYCVFTSKRGLFDPRKEIDMDADAAHPQTPKSTAQLWLVPPGGRASPLVTIESLTSTSVCTSPRRQDGAFDHATTHKEQGQLLPQRGCKWRRAGAARANTETLREEEVSWPKPTDMPQ